MPDEDPSKPAPDPEPEQSPDKPDPNVQPPAYDIVTEGWEPDRKVFLVRDAKGTKKDEE